MTDDASCITPGKWACKRQVTRIHYKPIATWSRQTIGFPDAGVQLPQLGKTGVIRVGR